MRVSLENVSCVFPGGVEAVRGLNLAVEEGELLVLVGPSGSGKSTTLRMIAGLARPTEGTIRIGERAVNDLSPQERDVAMVVQGHALYPHLTVRQNLAFALEMRHGGGWASWPSRWWQSLTHPAEAAKHAAERESIPERVAQAAHLLHIEHLLDRLPGELSGGEEQRVALGRAIVRRPAVFLFDEPLSNLDLRLRGELRGELKRLHRFLGTTMIYVTHDQEEALALGDRVAVLDRGRLQQIGTPRQVYDYPADRLVAEFIGRTPMNFVDTHWRLDEGRIRFYGGGLDFAASEIEAIAPPPAENTLVIVGWRPEDMRLTSVGQQLAAPWQSLGDARVLQVDWLGDSAIVRLPWPAPTSPCLSVSVEPDEVPSLRKDVWLWVRRDRLHVFESLFESPNGRRLGGGKSVE